MCQCTDARDGIFAVLSTMDIHSRTLIPFDYSLDVASVYASAVIATVSRYGSLDISSHTSFIEQPREIAWLTCPVLTLKQFELFLKDRDPQERTTSVSVSALPWNKLFPVQFTGDAFGPWRANVKVCMLDDMDALPALAIQDKPTTIVFWLKPYDSTYMNILPRFRSRAHFVDKVVYIYAQNSCIPEDNHPSTQDMLFSASYIWQQIFQRSAYLRQSYY
jgi:hypothetical protein